jgi:hypothetical protein
MARVRLGGESMRVRKGGVECVVSVRAMYGVSVLRAPPMQEPQPVPRAPRDPTPPPQVH